MEFDPHYVVVAPVYRPPPFDKYGPSWSVFVRRMGRKNPIFKAQYGTRDLAEFAGHCVRFRLANGLPR